MDANIAACQILMRMKMTQECADKVISVDRQGQDSIEDFACLNKKDVYLMFKPLTCPGGLNTITGVPNRGFKVSAATQGSVTGMCYLLPSPHDGPCKSSRNKLPAGYAGFSLLSEEPDPA